MLRVFTGLMNSEYIFARRWIVAFLAAYEFTGDEFEEVIKVISNFQSSSVLNSIVLGQYFQARQTMNQIEATQE